MNIEWRKIPGGDPAYEVSNTGLIRSHKRNPQGRIMNTSSKHYPLFQMFRANGGESIVMKVHKAVALAFVPNPDNKPFVAHKDGNRQNNNASNLEWSDWTEIMQGASIRKNGRLIGKPDRIPKSEYNGERVANSKLTDNDVAEIRRLYENGVYYQRQLADRFGVKQSTISGIIRGKHWIHIT